jgi:catechol 2,3-dioxygenase-like lactoylglutathione lyase family enzyme
MLQVKRAGHSTLSTPDIERQIDYFTRIVGLTLVARDKNRAILAVKAGQEAIVLERGSAVEAPRLSFQVAPGSDLGELCAQLRKSGIKSERRSDITPGIAEAIAFQDPKGTTLEIFSDFSFAAPDKTYTGVMPLKLGHIAYTCPDVQQAVKFYCDMLGFRVSDWRGDFFAFLRCSRDHHTVNFLRDPQTAIHHIAFEVRDWSDIKRACDMLADNDIHLTWGPIRHIIGHNIAIYHKNPDGVVIEFFTDMDQMHDEELGFFEPRPWHQDRPQRPKVWGDGTLSNWWGVMARSAPHGNQAAQPAATTAPSPAKSPTRKPAPATAQASARKIDKKTTRRKPSKRHRESLK